MFKLCYNKIMKKNIARNLSIIFSIMLFICVLFNFFSLNDFSQQRYENFKEVNFDTQMLYAVEEYDKETKIIDDEKIISSELWNALKVFYNNNKTSEMPSIKTTDIGDGQYVQYLTIDLFENFPISKLDLKGKGIKTIKNLSIFDLFSFEEIDLSNNKLKFLDNELSKIENLKKLNVSNNELLEFEYVSLNEQSYSLNLVELNLSHNNIVSCNLDKIKNAKIDLTHNELTKDKLTLPSYLDVEVELSYNYISEPNLTNTNIKFGIQGVKNNKEYIKGQAVEYYGIYDIEKVEIYFQNKSLVEENGAINVEGTKVAEIGLNEKYTFALGYYRLSFVTEIELDDTQDMYIYIYPQSPILKMFRNDKELAEIEYTFTSPTTIKFYGEENSTFAYSINAGELVFADKVEINTVGISVVRVYQIVDGYYSKETTLFLKYQPPALKGWIYIVVGTFIFVLLFYFAIKYYPKLIGKNLGKPKNNRTNLD